MVARTGVFLSDMCLFSVYISVDKVLDRAFANPTEFTLSTGFVTAVLIKGILIELRTTTFYGSDTTGLTVSYSGNTIRTPEGALLPNFSNVTPTNNISPKLLEYPSIRFPANFVDVVNVVDSAAGQAGANALIPNDPAQAAANTTKFQALIAANSDMLFIDPPAPFNRRPLYIPNGTYYFNARIENCANLTMFGETKEGVILKWVDNIAAFTNTTTRECCFGIGWRQEDMTGYGFDNYLYNLTFDIGNNPEAIGFGVYTNNGGGMYNIHVKGNGFAGVAVRAGAFPSSAMWFSVEGSRYGILMGSGSVFYNVKLKNQTEAGIYLGDPVRVNNPAVGQQSFVGGTSGTGGSSVGVHNLLSEQTGNVPVYKLVSANLVDQYSSHQMVISNGSFYSTGGDFALDQIYRYERKWIEIYNSYQRGYKGFFWDQLNGVVAGTTYIPRYSFENMDLSTERPIKGATEIFPQFPKFRTPDPATSVWRSIEEYPIGTGIVQGNQVNHGKALQDAFADTTLDVLYFPRATSSNDSHGFYFDPVNFPVSISGNRGGRDFLVWGLGRGFDIADGAINDANYNLVTINDIGGGTVTFAQLQLIMTTRSNTINAVIYHNSNTPFVTWDGRAGFSTVSGAPYSKKRHSYKVAPGRKPNAFFAGCLYSYVDFENGQYAVATNLNWNHESLNAADLGAPAIAVKTGAKLAAINRRTENLRPNAPADACSTLIDGVDSFMYEPSAWIDQHYEGSVVNDGPLYRFTNGGKYLGCMTEHDNNNQLLPKKYARDSTVLIGKTGGSGTGFIGATTGLQQYAPQMEPLNGSTGVYLNTFSSFSAGGPGTMSRPQLVAAVVGDPKNTFGNDKIWLLFDLPLFNSIPSTGAFAVTVAGASRSVSTVAISGTRHGNWHSHVCTLTLASAVTAGQAVVVSYTQPGTNPRLQSKQNALVTSFSNVSVVNLVV